MTAVHDGVLMIPVYKRRVVGVVMGLWQALICFCIYIYTCFLGGSGRLVALHCLLIPIISIVATPEISNQ